MCACEFECFGACFWDDVVFCVLRSFFVFSVYGWLNISVVVFVKLFFRL